MVDGLYPIVWTPDFVRDVSLAVEYVAKVLKAPIAARNLLEGIDAQLENVRAMPTTATLRKRSNGERFYMLSYIRTGTSITSSRVRRSRPLA